MQAFIDGADFLSSVIDEDRPDYDPDADPNNFFDQPIEGTRELATSIPNADLHLFEGAGHAAFEQRKTEWDEVIQRFLGPESAGSSRSRTY